MEQKPLEARLQLTESERERLYAAARASRMSTNRYLTHITRQALGESRLPLLRWTGYVAPRSPLRTMSLAGSSGSHAEPAPVRPPDGPLPRTGDQRRRYGQKSGQTATSQNCWIWGYWATRNVGEGNPGKVHECSGGSMTEARRGHDGLRAGVPDGSQPVLRQGLRSRAERNECLK